MKRDTSWSLILPLLVVLTNPAAPAPAQERRPSRPNILFLLADDQRPDTIAALGNPRIRTPNLDALVRRGADMVKPDTSCAREVYALRRFGKCSTQLLCD